MSVDQSFNKSQGLLREFLAVFHLHGVTTTDSSGGGRCGGMGMKEHSSQGAQVKAVSKRETGKREKDATEKGKRATRR